MLSTLEKVDLLRKAVMLRDVPTPGLSRVAAISNEETFVPNQMLYEENSPADSMFFMLEGEVELVRSDRRTRIDGQGQLLGGLAILAGGTYAELAIATQPTRVLRIDRQDLLDTMAEDFSVARGVLKALASMAVGAR